jgi:hypothetical protein
MQTPPPELRSLGTLIWSSFKGSAGATVGLLGTLATFASWFIKSNSFLPLSWLVGVTITGIAVIVTLFESTRRALNHVAHPFPLVKLALSEPTSKGKTIILLLDSSPLFSPGLLVSFYLRVQEQYESLIGSGVVQNVQDDGLIQIRVSSFTSNNLEWTEKILANDASYLKCLLIKPYVSQDILGVESQQLEILPSSPTRWQS